MKEKEILLRYAADRFQKNAENEINAGPVITISREYGCPAREFAPRLCEALNSHRNPTKKQWKVITKEIIEEAAQQLQVDAGNVEKTFSGSSAWNLKNLLASFSKKNYKFNEQVKETITTVIRSYANEGHVIIVGRAGVAITRSVRRSFHIRLQAPIEWRAGRLSQKYNLSFDEAKRYALDYDWKRMGLIEDFRNQEFSLSMFDAIYNCMSLKHEAIIKSVIPLLASREMCNGQTDNA